MFLIIEVLLLSLIGYGSNAVQVTIKQGILEGAQVPLVTGDGFYYSFKGIPYAESPAGELRFRHPNPPLNWTGVRNATSHGQICLQNNSPSSAGGSIVGDEDCLFLNVYTPSLSDDMLPVMIWIHGGGFVFLSGDDDLYGPDYIVPHNVVMVTFNYRVGPLGFLNLDTEEVPGNAGLKDQVAAMKWVQENIAQFGGDPKNVTIFGQSAGGVSVSLHMLSPKSKGLFQRAISISGTAFVEWALPFEQTRQAFALGRLLGMDTTDKNVLLSYLQNVNATRLINLQPNVLVNQENTYFLKTSYTTYAVENVYNENSFLNEDPLDVMIRGGAHDVESMFIQTNSEFMNFYRSDIVPRYAQYTELFAPRRILDYVPPATALNAADTIKKYYFGNETLDNDKRELLVKYFNDINSYDLYTFMEHLAVTNARSTYLLQLSAVSGRNVKGNQVAKEFGFAPAAGHADDWFYMFNPTKYNLKMTKDSHEYKLVQQFTTLITNFAKYGDPTPPWTNPSKFLGTVTWPEYTSSTKQYLDFGTSDITIQKGLRSEPYNMLESVYATAGICY